VDEKIPLSLIKIYLMGIFSGLNYLHSVCKVAHGGEAIPMSEFWIDGY